MLDLGVDNTGAAIVSFPRNCVGGGKGCSDLSWVTVLHTATDSYTGVFLYIATLFIQLTAGYCSVVSGGHSYKPVEIDVMLTSFCLYQSQLIVARRAYVWFFCFCICCIMTVHACVLRHPDNIYCSSGINIGLVTYMWIPQLLIPTWVGLFEL